MGPKHSPGPNRTLKWQQIPMQRAFLPLASVNGCSTIWNKS